MALFNKRKFFIIFLVCSLFVGISSCASAKKYNSHKKPKMKPCDCPQFGQNYSVSFFIERYA